MGRKENSNPPPGDLAQFLLDFRGMPVNTDVVGFEVFIDLYNKGLIYRGLRMINWDPSAKTTLSNEEVIYSDNSTKQKLRVIGVFKDFNFESMKSKVRPLL